MATWRRILSCAVVLGTLGVATCASDGTAMAASSPKSQTPPKSSYAQDTKYFTEVAEADPALASYEQKQGNVALRALLTDGSAFCALLERAKGLDEALVAEADGARSTETQTSLPLSVTTFNTIEAVALLTLCSSELKRIPAADRSKIRDLGAHLAKHPG